MADKQLVILIRQGPRAWNEWRKHNSPPHVDLSHADLASANLRGANLKGAHLTGAKLRGAHLTVTTSVAETRSLDHPFHVMSLRSAGCGTRFAMFRKRRMREPSLQAP